jgi:MFS transporter, DHA1 family, multidrug resistance protein
MARDTRIVLIVCLLAGLGYMSTDIYTPTLPAIAASFGVSYALVQSTITFFLLGFAFGQFIFGWVAEIIGRRRLALLALLVAFLATVGCVFSPNITSLIVFRFIKGVSLSATAVLYRAVLRDVYSGCELSLRASYISYAVSLSFAFSPLLGSYLLHLAGWRYSFVALALATAIVGILSYNYLPETLKKTNNGEYPAFFKGYIGVFKNMRFSLLSMCAGLGLGGILAYFTDMAYLIENNLGLSSYWVAMSSACVGAGLLLGGFYNRMLQKKGSPTAALFVGAMVMLMSAIALLFFASHDLTFINMSGAMFFYAFGEAIMFVNVLTLAMGSFQESLGLASAGFGALQLLMVTLCSAWIAVRPLATALPVGMVLLVSAVICMIAYRVVMVKNKEHGIE